MTLPASGAISFNNINVEIQTSGTAQISLNDTLVRTVFGQASGAIDMNTGHGKSYRPAVPYVFSANTTNASLDVTSISGYIAGLSDIVITINSGIWVYATTTANAGLTLTGGVTGDTIKIVNNGFIAGMGGAGCSAYNDGPRAGGNGGPALSLGFNTTIDNTNASAYIGGGGGGGGAVNSIAAAAGGGGAGGGTGGSSQGGTNIFSSVGGAGGAPGVAGTSTYGAYGQNGGGGGSGGGGGAILQGGKGEASYIGSGGGGGRIFPGTGGAGGTGNTSGRNGGAGGTGSAVGGAPGTSAAAGGGGWGASGGTVDSGTNISSGGNAVSLNGKTVTWISGDTTRVYGAVT
jgi:hypothetical protein